MAASLKSTFSDRNLAAIILILALIMAGAMFVIGLHNIPVSTDESIIALQSKHILTPPSAPEVLHSLHPKPLFFRFPLLFMAQPYLFPIEAYIAALPRLFLPANTLGARVVPFGLSLAALIFSFLVIRSFGRIRDTWPGLLLLVFPSAYVLMMQFGYALPGYPSHLFLTALAVWLLQRYAARPSLPTAAGCGMVCAAALAGQFMAAPLLLMSGVLLLLTGSGWKRLIHTGIFAVLAATGWLPIALAKRLYPGAHSAVSGRWPIPQALQRLWSPALDFVLPVASGIQTTVFPDNQRLLQPAPWLSRTWPYLWLLITAIALVLLARRAFLAKCNLAGDKKITAVVFPGLAVAAIALFILSRRSHSYTYRYLLNAAWAFPFVIAYIYSELQKRWTRASIASFAALLAGFNFCVIVTLMQEWSTPRFAADEAMFFDTAPAIAYLKEKGFNRVYAGYGLAYRLSYVTDEKIIAGQYFNERFHGWPMPYKSAVDQADRIAYVLAPQFALTADAFKADMQAMGVDMTTYVAGDLTIFHDFEAPANLLGEWLSPPALRARTSHNQAEADALIDGQYEIRWRSRQAQHTNMWVQLDWDTPVSLTSIYMYYNYYHYDRAEALTVSVLDEDHRWQRIVEPIPAGMDRFKFDNNRPVYGNQFQRIALGGLMARGLRIEIAEPNPGRDWTIGEIRLRGAQVPPH